MKRHDPVPGMYTEAFRHVDEVQVRLDAFRRWVKNASVPPPSEKFSCMPSSETRDEDPTVECVPLRTTALDELRVVLADLRLLL